MIELIVNKLEGIQYYSGNNDGFITT